MDDEHLADRFVSYADALAALSFVGMSGFSIALGDPDVRCSIVDGAYRPVVIGNLVSGLVISILLWLLRSWELDLRSGASTSSNAKRYAARIHVARYVVVWFSTGTAILILSAAANSASCLP